MKKKLIIAAGLVACPFLYVAFCEYRDFAFARLVNSTGGSSVYEATGSFWPRQEMTIARIAETNSAGLTNDAIAAAANHSTLRVIRIDASSPMTEERLNLLRELKNIPYVYAVLLTGEVGTPEQIARLRTAYSPKIDLQIRVGAPKLIAIARIKEIRDAAQTDRQALDEIARFADHFDPDVRIEAINALAGTALELGEPCPMALLRALEDDDEIVCQVAAGDLGPFKSFPSDAFEVLRRAVNSRDEVVSSCTMEAFQHAIYDERTRQDAI